LIENCCFRCREAVGDAYVPCTMALYRVQLHFFYAKFQVLILVGVTLKHSATNHRANFQWCNCRSGI